MSPKMLTDHEWFELHDQLSNAFATYSPNPAARAGLYFTELGTYNPESIRKAVKLIIKTHDRFPTIAQLITTINQIDPPPDPNIEAVKRESAEWTNAENERQRLFAAIRELPADERESLVEEANELCAQEFRKNNVPSWVPFKILRECRLLMLYREKYESQTCR